MSAIDQMKDNINTFTDFQPLNETEKETIQKVVKIMLDTPQIGCTACRYCTDGCPMSISIPDIFRAVNTMNMYGDTFRPKAFYRGLLKDHGKASDCLQCGQCESVCPQHLPIIELLKKASEMLDD